jgi:hypothetical protein
MSVRRFSWERERGREFYKQSRALLIFKNLINNLMFQIRSSIASVRLHFFILSYSFIIFPSLSKSNYLALRPLPPLVIASFFSSPIIPRILLTSSTTSTRQFTRINHSTVSIENRWWWWRYRRFYKLYANACLNRACANNASTLECC